jgi:hypothetical protein
MNTALTISIFMSRSDEMNYVKVIAVESHFSENELLVEFDYIKKGNGRYVVYCDGEPQIIFPTKEGYELRLTKSVAADEVGVVFLYYKLEEVV